MSDRKITIRTTIYDVRHNTVEHSQEEVPLSEFDTEFPLPPYKAPTEPEPDAETLDFWCEEEDGCEATDGCWVEFDGMCEHGYPSWALYMGLT